MKINSYILWVFVILGVFCGRLACMESEVDDVLAQLKARFDKPESKEIYEVLRAEVLKKNPRIVELARRIDIDDRAWDGMPLFKDILYSQIDELMLHRDESPNGLLAARVVRFVGGDAVSVKYWKRNSLNDDSVTKYVWMRRMPDNTIDQSGPLPAWFHVQEKEFSKITDLACIGGLCDDPMPPTIVPIWVKQERPEAAIIEFVIKNNGELKYRWAIRSNIFTSGYRSFLKMWDALDSSVSGVSPK